MVQKKIVIGLISLLIFVVFNPIVISEGKQSSLSSFAGDILYVGGSGPGNYSRIQDAVDNASYGDTVFVYSGIYSDFFPESWACVRIWKRIHLMGEEKNTTIINGTGFQRVVIVDHDADGVEVSGFTIQHGVINSPSDWALGIDVSSRTTIYDNIIRNTNKGIFINQQYTDIMIFNNTIIENENGIEASFNNRSFIKIFNNTISNNEIGIYSVYNNEVSVYENQISNNSVGIYLKRGESNNVIYHNQIRDNEIGINIEDSKSTKIQENNFIKNEKHATLVKGSLLSTIPLILLLRQRWIKNFWDDWMTKNPRPIGGLIKFYIIFIIPIKPFIITIPIGSLPCVEFDWRPAQETYDIRV